MSEIPEALQKTVLKRFEKDLVGNVKLILFTQKMECHFCKEARELLETVANWSDKITLEVHDFEEKKERAKNLGIDKIPGLAIVGEKDYGIRFFGIPAGYEFQTLIEGIILVSTDDSQLPQGAIDALNQIGKKSAHIRVFVIPTCTMCPIQAKMAMQFAVANDNIRVSMVEIAEFPHLANKYDVIGTPTTVINETTRFEGVTPPAQFIEHIKKAAQGSPTGISPTS
jgi:glutaredoxin-like protein